MSINSLVTVLKVDGPLVVSDPCYLSGELRYDGRNSALRFEKVAAGDWACEVLITEETQGWGPRVERLSAKHPSCLGKTHWSSPAGTVPVDSGQMSILPESEIANFKDDNDVAWDEESIQAKTGDFSYQGACQATLSEAQGGVIGDGRMLVSSTGYGDGQYDVNVWKDSDGVVYGIEIDFIPEEEGDDWDEEEEEIEDDDAIVDDDE